MKGIKEKIMVVDDDRGILESFDVLLGDDYNVLFARNGYEALEIFKKESPSLMFLDMRMPGIDGIEVLKRIKKESNDVKVVMITGMSDETIEEEARGLGVFDYLNKPVCVEDIVRIASGLN